jgi:hypothetical protein
MLFMKRQSDTRVLEQNAKVRIPTLSCQSSSLLSCYPNVNYILVFLHIGTLGMTAKTKKEIRQKSHESAQTRTPKKNDVRRCITARAMVKDDMCTMKLHVYMLHNNEWYLHCHSCLKHSNHPRLPAKAKAKSSMDMSPGSKSLVSTSI